MNRGSGSSLSLASATNPSVPSEPQRTALRSKWPSPPHMGEVVASQAAIELREALLDEVRVLALQRSTTRSTSPPDRRALAAASPAVVSGRECHTVAVRDSTA